MDFESGDLNAKVAIAIRRTACKLLAIRNANQQGMQTYRRLLRFSAIGPGGMPANRKVLFLPADPWLLNWGLSAGKAVGKEAAMAGNLLWNDLWMFREIAAEAASRRGRSGLFNLMCLVGIGLYFIPLNMHIRFFHTIHYFANLTVIFVASLWDFGKNLQLGWGRFRA